jgi:hypothetical protein
MGEKGLERVFRELEKREVRGKGVQMRVTVRSRGWGV